MLKKVFIIFVFLIYFVPAGISKEVSVKIVPVSKITTSNLKLQNGDDVEFTTAEDVNINNNLVFKKGQKIYGTIISREENGFLNEPANIYIENLYTNQNGKRTKLKGIVYKQGRSHDMINGFLPVFDILIRGGEVQIKPNKDVFTIYFEEK